MLRDMMASAKYLGDPKGCELLASYDGLNGFFKSLIRHERCKNGEIILLSRGCKKLRAHA